MNVYGQNFFEKGKKVRKTMNLSLAAMSKAAPLTC